MFLLLREKRISKVYPPRARDTCFAASKAGSLTRFLLRQFRRSASVNSVAEDAPYEKTLRSVSFVVHATRGVIRDQTARRKAMMVLLGIALFLLLAGSTFLAPFLNPREHLGWALTFWIVCVWLTLTSMLLALLDLLKVRAAGRAAERSLRQRYERPAGADQPANDLDDRKV